MNLSAKMMQEEREAAKISRTQDRISVEGQAFEFDAVIRGLPILEGGSRSSDNDQPSQEIARLDHLSKHCRPDQELTE